MSNDGESGFALQQLAGLVKFPISEFRFPYLKVFFS